MGRSRQKLLRIFTVAGPSSVVRGEALGMVPTVVNEPDAPKKHEYESNRQQGPISRFKKLDVHARARHTTEVQIVGDVSHGGLSRATRSAGKVRERWVLPM